MTCTTGGCYESGPCGGTPGTACPPQSSVGPFEPSSVISYSLPTAEQVERIAKALERIGDILERMYWQVGE